MQQLSDFEPKGAACQAFGVLHEGGFPQRALVIVGQDGVVGWSYQAPSPAELPGLDPFAGRATKANGHAAGGWSPLPRPAGPAAPPPAVAGPHGFAKLG